MTLSDLSASINLLSLSIYKKLGLGNPKPTMMKFLMDDRTIRRTIGRLYNVQVKVEAFIFLAGIVILYCEVDFQGPIIIGIPFLNTGRALVYVEKRKMKLVSTKKKRPLILVEL